VEKDEQQLASDVATWRPWAGQVRERGDFYTPDIDRARRQFLEAGLSPTVFLLDRFRVGSLSLPGTRVHSWPERAAELQALVALLNARHGLGLQWHAQNVASTTWLALKCLLRKTKRRELSALEKRKLAQKQGGRCARCMCACPNGEFDHVIPVHEGQPQGSWQMLCQERRRQDQRRAPQGA
jgi:hypothetical protein